MIDTARLRLSVARWQPRLASRADNGAQRRGRAPVLTSVIAARASARAWTGRLTVFEEIELPLVDV